MIRGNQSILTYLQSLNHFEALIEEQESFIRAHTYLFIRQSGHIGTLQNLEELAKDKVYEFCYVCTPNMIEGTTTGFTLRPLTLP